jgi:adenosylcobyric acid synthase
MFQGTGSDVGKSLIVAGLCRAYSGRGLRVRPFKPQNMSNNAAVAVDGGEIGRAQALQARAAGIETSVHMNPVLLKPETDLGVQVVVRGRVRGHATAREYQSWKAILLPEVLESFSRLRDDADLVLVEGAGSPAEVNLRRDDIANMGFARAAGVPAVLIGDIDRGGVIANLVGTAAVLDAGDRELVRGFMINKLRGDASLFDDGIASIGRHTGWPCFGVVPWMAAARDLPAEDAVVLDRPMAAIPRPIKIAMPHLPRIANFDDLDPLRLEPDVTVVVVPPGRPLPLDADLVVLPGSKATLADLAFLRAQGWDIDVKAHVRRGGHVIGLCGGYQMLGRRIADLDGLEGRPAEASGLGLLDVETTMEPGKSVRRVSGTDRIWNRPISGYEIHIGRTSGPDCSRPLVTVDGRDDGAMAADGRVMGCYVHGLFVADAFRQALLARLKPRRDSGVVFETRVEAALDSIADILGRSLDLNGLLAAAR